MAEIDQEKLEWVRSTAEAHGFDPDLAQAFVEDLLEEPDFAPGLVAELAPDAAARLQMQHLVELGRPDTDLGPPPAPPEPEVAPVAAS
jgi:hypothetical protein